ncbi:MAG: 4-alpha-glucanotransferase [Ginsengibacter sp.]
MTIHFFIKYHTSFGESLFITGNHTLLGNGELAGAVEMTYYNDEFWHAIIEFPGSKTQDQKTSEKLIYRYVLRDLSGINVFEGEADRYLNLNLIEKESVSVIDTWNSAGEVNNVFFTKAFGEVLLPDHSLVKPVEVKDYTHEFRVKAPLLPPGQAIVLVGSTPNLKSWDTGNPIFLSPENNWFVGKVHLNENEWPATYKYGIYDLKEKKFLQFEDGENRNLYKKKEGLTIFQDGFVRYSPALWKGGGVAVPVFSLRSKSGFGVGEFADIKLLIDWAIKTNLKLIQILPVNDTIANKDWSDSYPYAAISAFALHPLYINLDKVAGKDSEAVLKTLKKKKQQLNKPSTVDYEQVMKLKSDVLQELFQKKKASFKKDIHFKEFLESNKHWLIPYAVFCFLRDRYNTPDFSKWKTHSVYDASAIEKLASPGSKNYDSILYFYFVQYHLHIQLKEVADYANMKKVVLKGDIPIGIYRFSCDAWVNPELYNMDQQAGAPPDDFAIKGQNWGFPTYNWHKMKENHFEWWRARFNQMNRYFDAFRIDHILGFFRIWSIPDHAIEGILGKFVPAIPVDISEFHYNDIDFNYARFCVPYITDDILGEIFQERKQEIKDTYLDVIGNHQYHLKEFVNTQKKVAEIFAHKEDNKIKQGLFDLLNNIILIEEEGSEKRKFHFRIAMENTSSFSHFDGHTQHQLKSLYVDYFYRRQEDLWRREGMEKLPALKQSTDMLIFGEDLGMVPDCVPEVMKQLSILSLEIERMPKKQGAEFFHPKDAPYLSVVTPATHDMSTIRGWWEENREATQRFYNYMLGHYGEAPAKCEPWISKEILVQHFYSPAMWCIIQIQDLFGIDESLRPDNPGDERINIPANPNHRWRYRMHINLENLLKENSFNNQIKNYMVDSGRSNEAD